MEAQQTPRSPEDPVVVRGSPMVRQNLVSPGPGSQPRPQGQPPLSPRYPTNNGSSGGPRIGGQQAPTAHRLDVKSSVGSPTSPGGQQFVQQRPPFGQTRPQNSQVNQIVGPRPIPGPAPPPPLSHPQSFQGAPRYPGIPSSPGVRPPAANFPGYRAPLHNTNQPQQINYSPKVTDIRSERPINPDSVKPVQIRSTQYPHNPEERRTAPQIIPDTLITPPARNNLPFGDERANDRSGGLAARQFTNESTSQPIIRQQYPRDDKMEVIDNHSSSPGARESEPARDNSAETNDNISEGKPSARAASYNDGGDGDGDGNGDDDEDDTDDDDDAMNIKKKIAAKIVEPEKITNDKLRPESVPVNTTSGPASPASSNSYEKSASPSPVATGSPQTRPTSTIQVQPGDKSPGEKLSSAKSPVPSQDKTSDTNQSELRLGDSPKCVDLASAAEDTEHAVETMSKVGTIGDETKNAVSSPKRTTESTSNDVRSSVSPILPRTPDPTMTLTAPGSPSPISSKSPILQSSAQNIVHGFDNGQLRSLSPKSPDRSVTPTSPKPPDSPITPIEAGLANDDDKKKSTPVENSKPLVLNQTNNEQKNTDVTVTTRPITPMGEVKGKPPTPSKFSERAQTPGTPDGRKSSMTRSTSGRSIKSDGESDGVVNQKNPSTPTTNGVAVSPTKKLPSKSRDGDKRTPAASPVKSPSKSVKSLPRTPEAGPPSTADKKKVPMNKVQVGAAPSPNLKTVRSKIGSLDNASYKPGGGKVKIENRKLDFSKAQPKIAAKNDKYMPSGGDKKITQVKLQWNAKPKVGSLDNATYKPGGGDKKIETVKLDFKDKAKPKVGSKDNAKHVPGGGTVKSSATTPKTPQDQPNDIETQKIDIKAESKIGSLENVKHKPGGGDKKIFNDRDYLRQTGSNVESLSGSGAQSPVPSNAIIDGNNGLVPTSDENLNEEC